MPPERDYTVVRLSSDPGDTTVPCAIRKGLLIGKEVSLGDTQSPVVDDDDAASMMLHDGQRRDGLESSMLRT